MKIGGGHFAPKLGGHFELESGDHFKLELGGQYHWNLHKKVCNFSKMENYEYFQNSITFVLANSRINKVGKCSFMV